MAPCSSFLDFACHLFKKCNFVLVWLSIFTRLYMLFIVLLYDSKSMFTFYSCFVCCSHISGLFFGKNLIFFYSISSDCSCYFFFFCDLLKFVFIISIFRKKLDFYSTLYLNYHVKCFYLNWLFSLCLS